MFDVGQEKRAAQWRAWWSDYQSRLKQAGLPSLDTTHYENKRPRTEAALELHRDLLIAEGKLDPESLAEIQGGLDDINVNRLVQKVLDEIADGKPLPDPFYANGDPVYFAKQTQDAHRLAHFEALRRMNLADSPRYEYAREQARLAMYNVKKQRGDFKQFFETIHPVEKDSDPDKQHAESLVDPVRVRLLIPQSVISAKSSFPRQIRYHPEYGLIAGHVHEDSYYDRGASSYPGGRGSRVTDYTVSATLLLEGLKINKIVPKLTRISVWVIAKETGAVIGRWRDNNSIWSTLMYKNRFSERAMAERFLTGSIESKFFLTTLPVQVERSSDGYLLHFEAKRVASVPS